MKNWKQKRALFDAVSGIDEALIDEAAVPPARPMRKPLGRRVVRFAAIAAALAILLTAGLWWPTGEESYVTGPGLLTVRAYALDEGAISEANSTVLEEGVELPRSYDWSVGINSVHGIPLHLSFPEDLYPDAKITFAVKVTGGEFETLRQNTLGQSFTAENNTTIVWNHLAWFLNEHKKADDALPDVFSGDDDFDGSQAFVDIIIYADDHIVGYAVVEIYEVNGSTGVNAYIYNARVLEIVSFPMVDGEFQNITVQYVTNIMESRRYSAS